MSTKEFNGGTRQSEEPKKYCKLKLSWYLAGIYLDILRGIVYISCDKEFNRLFGELRDYVERQLLSQFEGEINDIFVVAEQIIPTETLK